MPGLVHRADVHTLFVSYTLLGEDVPKSKQEIIKLRYDQKVHSCMIPLDNILENAK